MWWRIKSHRIEPDTIFPVSGSTPFHSNRTVSPGAYRYPFDGATIVAVGFWFPAVISTDFVLVHPFSSLTVSDTVYTHPVANVKVAFIPVSVHPSGKFHV